MGRIPMGRLMGRLLDYGLLKESVGMYIKPNNDLKYS